MFYKRRRVYFVQGQYTKLIKIGFSFNPKARLKALQLGSPDPLVLLGVMPCWEASEAILHEDFKQYKVHGEWYAPGEKLLKYIAANAKPLDEH